MAKLNRRRVRELIKEKELTVKDFADHVEVTPEYMSQILTGKRKPGKGRDKLMAYILEVPIEDVLTEAATKAKAS